VEVAGLADKFILVRDSKDTEGHVLCFTANEWKAFLGGAKNGEFGRLGLLNARSYGTSSAAIRAVWE
jgi:hypothetical protein